MHNPRSTVTNHYYGRSMVWTGKKGGCLLWIVFVKKVSQHFPGSLVGCECFATHHLLTTCHIACKRIVIIAFVFPYDRSFGPTIGIGRRWIEPVQVVNNTGRLTIGTQ